MKSEPWKIRKAKEGELKYDENDEDYSPPAKIIPSSKEIVLGKADKKQIEEYQKYLPHNAVDEMFDPAYSLAHEIGHTKYDISVENDNFASMMVNELVAIIWAYSCHHNLHAFRGEMAGIRTLAKRKGMTEEYFLELLNNARNIVLGRE